MPVAALPVLVASLVIGPAAAERWRPPELRVKDRPPATSADEIKDLAFQYLGRPYVMGGVGSPGFDCSGFVCRVYAEAGYALPRVSRDQALVGRSVDPKAMAPGDLVFFAAEPGESRIAHVGIYLGNRELVHASTGQGGVVVADLGASWFVERVVAARRILPDPGAPLGTTSTSTMSVATSSIAIPKGRAIELVEHTGDTVLLPMFRLPAKRPRPSFGPELAEEGTSAIGARGALVTERGVLGLVIAPEATLRLESIALHAIFAVPVRFQLGDEATVGALDGIGDWTRFLRSLSLGLRGADLEVRLSRLGDATLGGGLVVDRLAPASAVRAVPGLAIARSPLTLYGRVRAGEAEIEALADDVVDPGLLGASLALPAGDLVRAGLAFATDQHATLGTGARRAVIAGEGTLTAPIVERSRWTVELGAGASAMRAIGESGATFRGRAFAEHRFGGSAVSAEVYGGWLGPRAFAVPFGPTWASGKADVMAALAETSGRAELGGELVLGIGRVAIGLGYADALGAGKHALDQRASIFADVGGIGLGGTRLLGLRVAWAARAPFEGADRIDVLHAGARLRLSSWLHAELYVEKGEAVEGGGGLALAFAP